MEELKKNEKLEQLESVDFTNEGIDINDAYETIKDFKAQYEDIKKLESENILTELGPKYFDGGFVEQFKKERDNLRGYIKRYDPNTDDVKNMAHSDIDKIYQIANYLFNVWQMKLNEMVANFDLTKEEFKLIDMALNHKLDYDVNEALNLADLKAHWLDIADLTYKSLSMGNKNEIVKTKIEIGKCVILYHLISKFRVKGSGKEFGNLLSVIQKIGDINKLFNALTVMKERVSSELQLWGGNLPIKLETEEVQTEVQTEEVQTEVQ